MPDEYLCRIWKKFDNGKSTKIQIWNEISAKLKQFGFSVTGTLLYS